MHSPAAAVAWEFGRRHRWGLIAVAGYLLVLAAIKLLILGPGHRASFDDTETFAFVVIVPLFATFMYFLAVFTFGLAGDIAARQSMYHVRMFTLPVTSSALAGWPMLYGSAAMASLWLATRLFALWPSGIDVPVIWPALLAASLLAWTQALTWLSYPLRGLRVIVTVLWLAVIDAVVMVALELKASEPVMLALLAPHIPLAFLAARSAVARARRGDVPDWRRLFAWLGRIADVLSRRRDRFSSPARAQEWFEWRRHGRSLPALVGILLPFEVAFLFVFHNTPSLVLEALLLALVTPPFMATFVAATVSKSNPGGRDSYDLTPFIATRPLTSVSLTAVKLNVTILSTLAAWLLVLIALPLGLRLSGALPVVVGWARDVVEVVGTPRAVVILLLGVAALMASTWKQLVQGLFIGLSGREWVVKASVFLTLSLLAIAWPLGRWILGNRAVVEALWNAFPWIVAVLVCLKLSAAAWVAMRLHDSRLLSGHTLVIGAACWAVTVFVLYGLLVWIVPNLIVRSYLLTLVVILEVPLARISAAPLALAWNRHR